VKIYEQGLKWLCLFFFSMGKERKWNKMKREEAIIAYDKAERYDD